ncbi:MAG: hypothetical protein U5L08_02680 [Xanthomonadales bacterium]|nr:hypothetical protein [Xanthomonadales bacterium]
MNEQQTNAARQRLEMKYRGLMRRAGSLDEVEHLYTRYDSEKKLLEARAMGGPFARLLSWLRP